MYCSFASLLSLQVTLAATWSLPQGKTKRGAETDATLYAYGTNTSAWPVAYGLDDGKLYVASEPNNTAAGLAQVTWDLAAITGEDWIANATLANGTEIGSLYIMHEDFDAVAVAEFAAISEINGTVSGFALFATQLVYNNNSELESQFWAQSTDTDGIYALMWNADGDLQDDSFPVTLKASENA